jgi:hypothetical protein
VAALQRKLRVISMYSDSSTDEEGPDASSLFWTLTRREQPEYKAVLRAYRRAHNRVEHIRSLRKMGITVVDIEPVASGDGAAGRSDRRRGIVGSGAVCLPCALATSAAVKILSRFISNNRTGNALSRACSTQLHAYLGC